jgi:para-nitrobenzyl esterase
MRRILRQISVLTTATMISACGGGGGDDAPSNPPVVQPPPLQPDQVETAAGVVEGNVEGDLLVFRGIRYAAPPVGELRFKAPQPPTALTDVYAADTFGAKCIQPLGTGTIGDEDCLFVNVWTHNDDLQRPVLVYLHPGAAGGVGGDLTGIDPAGLAADGDVVVVNFNRRLGVMGNLALDELVLENPLLTAGNYGVLDVIAALEWVNENIAEFNGDPNRVMLFGTSAGAVMTCSVLGAPAAVGLIHAAGIQSAPCPPALVQVLNDQLPVVSRLPPATVTHRDILPAIGCDTAADILACLRDTPAETLVIAGISVDASRPWIVFAPIVDGVVVQQGPHGALENMTAGDIPIIVGVTDNEIGDRFADLDLPDDASYRNHLASVFADPVDDLLYALYPSTDYPTPKDAFLQLWADAAFSCAAQRLALAAASGAPSYLYEITRGFDTGPFAGQGATHAIDTAYLFGNFASSGITPDTQALAISAAMRAAWTGLARDPTTAPPIAPDASVLWPVYDPSSATWAEFGEEIAGKTDHRAGRCSDLFAIFG